MNRIVLVGNGFDLAHGLKTSYADFILWYCEKRIKESVSSDTNESKDLLCTFIKRNDSNSILKQIQNLRQQGKQTEKVDNIIKKIINNGLAKPQNPFFKNIFDMLSNKGWVDIENIYYRFLFPSNEVRNIFNQNQFHYEKNPEILNNELANIQSLLIEYLHSIQSNNVNNSILRQDIWEKIVDHIQKNDIAVSSENCWTKMLQQRVNYPKEVWCAMAAAYYEDALSISETISRFLRDQSKAGTDWINNLEDVDYAPCFFFKPDRIMMVNFNYTTLADMYLPCSDYFCVNHIHGNLKEPHSVIFGYGDEMDENYKRMSDKNDNEYLRNIKSIKYLEAANYRNLLEFIESDCFQIFIMGHSCGNSDRTLLNTLFEHKNCVSIKPFYHVFEDGRDNYMELVQNISRNFTDKTLMRSRVVNKTFCDTI